MNAVQDGGTRDYGTRTRRFVVLNDAPVGAGTDDDLLEVTEVARGLADLIGASRATAPFALAVDAAWGMGKSSLMHQLEATLSAETEVSVLWFNAWTSGRASALEGLIKSVLLRFDRNVIRRALRSMSRHAHLIGVVRAAALAAASFFGLGRVVDEMWQRMSLDAQSRNEINGVLRDALGVWLDKGGNPDGRRLLVVFVDDLDRCASERIIEVCEAIKLYLDVPGVVFVLGCDQNALAQAVHESAGVGDQAAIEYLEKIVQISYRIPIPSMEKAMRLVDGYLRRSHTSGLFDESMKNVIIGRSGRNPRRIKRLINSFVLEYHLNRSWDAAGVENLVKVIMLQHFYPGFYQLLASPSDTDPIKEFLSYHEFRTTVKQHGEVNADRWAELFRSKGLRPPGGPEALAELEDELPTEYRVLAADRDFVALLGSVDVPTERLVEQLQRRPLTTAEPPKPAPAEPVTSPRRQLVDRRTPRQALRTFEPRRPGLRGLRVLWIDDKQSSNVDLAEYLVSSGVRLELGTERAEALRTLQRFRPDAMLSDFTHGADEDAGISDLAYFRKDGGAYDGPVLFFSGKIPDLALQERIRELGADGPTNNEEEVVRWLERVASRKKR